MNFVVPDFYPAAAEIFVAVMALVTMLASAFARSIARSLAYYATQFTLIAAAFVTIYTMQGEPVYTFNNLFISDLMGDFLKLMIYFSTAIALLYGRAYLADRKLDRPEYYVLALLMTLGMMVMVSANHMLSMYIGLEMMSLALYTMVAFDRNSPRSTEAAMKYFVLGALASGLLLYGMSMIYGATGSLEFSSIAQAVYNQTANQIVLMFGLVFLGADMLGRRVGAVPTAGGLATGLALLAAGIAVGVVYLRRQWHLPVPLFPVDLLRIPVFRLSMCTSVGAFAAQMLAYVGLPFFLLDGLGRSPVEAGLLITAWPLGTVVAAPLAGRLIGRYPDGLLGGIGLGLFASGLGLLALLPAQPTGADIVWRMALCGIGFGLFQSPNNHTIVTSAPVHRSGGASGMLGTARLTGQTTGAVLLAMIFSVADAHDGRGPTIALGLAALFACVAAGFSLRRLRHGVPGKSG